MHEPPGSVICAATAIEGCYALRYFSLALFAIAYTFRHCYGTGAIDDDGASAALKMPRRTRAGHDIAAQQCHKTYHTR